MEEIIDRTIERMVERGGPPFHELPEKRGAVAMLMRLLGIPPYTHYYERIDGDRILLTREEVSGIAPIELEMFPKKVARRMMVRRRKNQTDRMPT